MIQAVFLDSGPLGLVSQRDGKSAEADDCKKWMARLDIAGIAVYIPEIIDYEVRRELLRAGKIDSVQRLDRLKMIARYLPVTTDAFLLASELWAQARKAGIVTSDPKALDADVILCAQALTMGLEREAFVVATANTGHIGRFVPAHEWERIMP